MNIEHTYNVLDSTEPNSTKEQALKAYLKERLLSVPPSSSERIKAAYDCAGLLSTSYARDIEPGNVYEEILTLAGELEVPGSDNDAKWEELIGLVVRL